MTDLRLVLLVLLAGSAGCGSCAGEGDPEPSAATRQAPTPITAMPIQPLARFTNGGDASRAATPASGARADAGAATSP